VEVETDGTVDPESAFLQALDILLAHFQFVKENLMPEEKEAPIEEPVQSEEKAEAKEEKPAVADNKELSELKISSRTLNVLAENKIKSVSGLTSKTEEQIANLKGMGEKGIKEIRKALKKIDLDFKL
jgi:DNA-directed RNA polymerase subunit alpha